MPDAPARAGLGSCGLLWCTWLLMMLFGTGLLCGAAYASGPLSSAQADVGVHTDASAQADGLRFDCDGRNGVRLQADMAHYLHELGIGLNLYRVSVDEAGHRITYTLRTPEHDTNTLDFFQRPKMHLTLEEVRLPRLGRTPERVRTVSRKEIVLALMQHGRTTVFQGEACQIQALQDHVNLRQTIVAWSERLNWQWPDGGSAQWHQRYWHDGTPVPNRPLRQALLDAFTNQTFYSMGCYTATKLTVLQGVVDYYSRRRARADLSRLVFRRIDADGDPLVHIEPGDMWWFEDDFDSQERDRPGKLLKMLPDVAPKNFVPGDWAYLRNTDEHSRHKIGYEGSNALYLGRNLFDDYYDDHDHAYTFNQKLDEVYQWRHGVFSRRRDAAKIEHLDAGAFDRLSLTPRQGGLVMGYRAVPYVFGYEPLPALPPAQP